MPRTRDELTPAIRGIMLPALRPFNFSLKSSRLLVRVRDNILQFVNPQVTAFGNRDFCVNYASMSLFLKRDHFVLDFGERLQNSSNAEAWWPSKSKEEARTSVEDATLGLQKQALPFFDATGTVLGYLRALQGCRWGSMHHQMFEIGCCMARLRQHAEAEEVLAKAIALYQEDGRNWCEGYIQLAVELKTALHNGKEDRVLQSWLAHSLAALRIGPA